MAQLLGPDGRPIKRQALQQEQARPSLAGVRQPWAESVALGLTPERLSALLRAAAQGEARDYAILAEEMEERDAHYASVLGTRKRAASGLQAVVHPGGDDPRAEEIADAVREDIVESDGWPGLVEDLMDAVGKGWSAVEIEWRPGADRWRPAGFAWADPRWFTWDRDTGRELRLLTDAEPAWGEPLAPWRWITHTARHKSGLPLRGGLARLVAFGWLCKAYAVKDWVSFAEIYGLPLRLGRYGPSATKEDVRVLHQAVAAIGTDAAAVLPESMRIDFQELAAKSDGGQLFEKLARWVDEQTSKAVLGQTMTADSGSSRSQAEVHDEVRHDILRADARAVAASVNRDLVAPYVAFNWGADAPRPRIELPVNEPEDLAAIMAAAQTYLTMGGRLRAADLREKLGFAAPDPDDPEEEILGGPPKPAAAPDRAAAAAFHRTLKAALNSGRGAAPGGCDCASCRSAAARAEPFETQADPYADLDDIEAEAAAEWEPQLAPLIDPIRRLVAEASSLEEVLERLPELAGEADLGPMVEGLVSAMFRGRALGDLDGPETGAEA